MAAAAPSSDSDADTVDDDEWDTHEKFPREIRRYVAKEDVAAAGSWLTGARVFICPSAHSDLIRREWAAAVRHKWFPPSWWKTWA
jgi:Ni/Co efflux regulator RcnB